jgi:hypothetical protein
MGNDYLLRIIVPPIPISNKIKVISAEKWIYLRDNGFGSQLDIIVLK